MSTRVGGRNSAVRAIRKLAAGLTVGLGMAAVSLVSSGTAAAQGVMLLSASHPAIIDSDGTQGDWYPAVQGLIDRDGFQDGG